MRKPFLNSSTAIITTFGESPYFREVLNNAYQRGKDSAAAKVYYQDSDDGFKYAVTERKTNANVEGDYLFPDGSHRKRMVAQPR